jgi:putative endonuclease
MNHSPTIILQHIKDTARALMQMLSKSGDLLHTIVNPLLPFDRRIAPKLHSKNQTGQYGERVAEAYLKKQKHMRLIGRNYKTPRGEIDLIFLHDNVLVFVEVKTRSFSTLQRPADAVDNQKRLHLHRAGQSYLRQLQSRAIYHRYDIVEVFIDEGKVPQCRWIQNINILSWKRRH